MKKQSITSLSFKLTLIIGIVFLLASCEKNDNEKPVYSYLEDYELVKTLTKSSVVATMSTLSFTYPEAASLKDHVNYDVQVYKVTYKTHYKSEKISVSGLICVPVASEKFPMVSFQNGTNTLNANAPSMNHNNPAFLYLESFAGCGYVVLIPDYIGFGASSQYVHPYYVTEPTTNAIVDLFHAAKEFLNNGPSSAQLNDHNYLMGYSQGGWSTLCAFKRLESGVDTIPVKAASCGAGAYNIINAANYIAGQETYPSPLYLPYYFYSHQQYGSLSEPLDLIFKEPYASKIPGLFDGQHSHSQINSELTDSISSLLQPDFISFLTDDNLISASFQNIKNDMLANSIGAWPINGLLHFYHGNADDNVPVTESQNIYHDFIQLNQADKVEYFELDGLNHDTGVIPWGVKTLIWFNELENKN